MPYCLLEMLHIPLQTMPVPPVRLVGTQTLTHGSSLAHATRHAIPPTISNVINLELAKSPW